jgi:2-oxoisovalerate dehydrogenase E1 component beta subunit
MAEMTLLDGVRAALWEEMERDEAVVLLGEDIGLKGGVFRVTQGFQERFGPLRVLDTPIAELAIAGIGIGGAMAGLRPVLEFQFADYSHPAFDQIANQAATIRYRSVGAWDCPIVCRAPFGAGVGGGLYHSQSVEALYCHLPGIKVVVPATAADARGLLKSAIRDDDPVWFFEHKRSYRRYREAVPDWGPDEGLVPIGVGRIDRPGDDISLITYGVGVHLAREAAALVEASESLSVEILDLRTLAPLDRESIARTVGKTNRALIVHEANKTMGIGAEVSAFIAEELFESLDAPVVRVAAADCHLPHAPTLEEQVIPNVQSIVDALLRLAAY